jgi:hypothetical protein
MYCPLCRAELKLVQRLTPEHEPEYEDLVTVFEGDSSGAAVARATVESAGIESWVKDEEVHGLFPNMGSTEILVCSEDAKPALKALETPEPCAPVRRCRCHSTSKQVPAGG